MEQKKTIPVEMILFFILIACVAMANGLSDQVYGNYYKEVYNATAEQRGFIEVPRELPGVLCTLVIAVLSSFGDLRVALIAQILSCFGLTVMGLWIPSFNVMLVFLFINSLGNHTFMPIQDSIGMSLAEKGKVGKRMGQYASVRSMVGLAAALVVFFGFRLGWFNFSTPIVPFLLGAGMFVLAIITCVLLIKRVKPPVGERKKLNLVFRKQYKYFYMLTILNGVKKQIAMVYGSWVIIDILLRGADTIALLAIVVMFISIFFARALGGWMDRFGVKKMMFVEALLFVSLYTVFGIVVWGIDSGAFPSVGWPVFAVFGLYIIDRVSTQMGIIRSIYLRSIALDDREVTSTLSTGVSLDHIVTMFAATAGGFIWANWGSQWVFFMAALFSVGNLIVAFLVKPEEERAYAEDYKQKQGLNLPS